MSRQFHSTRPSRPGPMPIRLLRCMIAQNRFTYTCPPIKHLDGKLVLVTGGSGGIGAEIVAALLEAGADVLDCSRSSSEGGAKHMKTDLSDLSSVNTSVQNIQSFLGSRKLHMVIANAGIIPTAYKETVDGYESAFAVNCLGHFALIRGLIDHDLLAPKARIVGTAGDIYVLAKDCTTNFQGSTLQMYCRSKLGAMWMYREIAKRMTEYETIIVHPGVVATNLDGGETNWFSGQMQISTHLGSQAALIAATYPAVKSGDYFHNTRGILRLSKNDRAADDKKSAEFWNMLARLYAEHQSED